MVKFISSSALVVIFPRPNRSNFAAHLPPSGLPVHMHVSPQGHCGYLDFAHALSSSAGVHFLTTGRFCWNYPQIRTVRSSNGFTFVDVTKGSVLPCAQWKSHHRQSALQRTSHCSGLIFSDIVGEFWVGGKVQWQLLAAVGCLSPQQQG